jgi:hypothetical protein
LYIKALRVISRNGIDFLFCGYFIKPLFLWLLVYCEIFLNFNKKILNIEFQQVTEVCLEGLMEDRSELVINPTG